MMTLLRILAPTLLLYASSMAANVDLNKAPILDVVYTSDGEIYRGLIIEHIPGHRYRIVLPNGQTVDLSVTRVERIAKEPNPNYSAPAPTPPRKESDEAKLVIGPPVAKQGRRLGVSTGFAFPVAEFGEADVFKSSPHIVFRGGYEIMWSRFGLTPGGRLDYIYFRNDLTGEGGEDVSHHFIHFGGDLRFAGHFSKLAPYFSFGFGADLNFMTNMDGEGRGFGLNQSFGADVMLSPWMDLGLAVTIHPGFTDVAESMPVDVSYLSAGLSLSLH